MFNALGTLPSAVLTLSDLDACQCRGGAQRPRRGHANMAVDHSSTTTGA
jgi:hypothetical protein